MEKQALVYITGLAHGINQRTNNHSPDQNGWTCGRKSRQTKEFLLPENQNFKIQCVIMWFKALK